MDPNALKRAFAQLELTRILTALKDEGAASLPDLSPLRSNALSDDQRNQILPALINCAKRRLQSGVPAQALALLLAARSLGLRDSQVDKRIELLKQAPSRTDTAWVIALQDMQREFRKICRKDACTCTNHYQMAVCLGVFGTDEPSALSYLSCDILTLGLYRSWSLATPWSEIVKLIKRDYQQQYLVFAARVLADFVLTKSSLLRSVDFLVPVPPSTTKYGKRGFAPTDLLALEVSRLLCVPMLPILNRSEGTPTREASDEEFGKQFSLEQGTQKHCSGAKVLLIEDVVTTGRTVSVCAGKLRDAKVASVSAIALAKATRF